MSEPISLFSAFSQENYELSLSLGEQLRQRRLTLVCAESCTGGLVSAQIVAVPGSSDYFLGGVVAYANQIKAGVLGVQETTLAEHGAVSWQTATEMATGVRRLFGVSLALSTTGIAGPSGGTPLKPVGLVYVALATSEHVWWEGHRWMGSRGENNVQTAQATLALLKRYLDGEMGDASDDARGSVALPETGTPIQVELSPGATWPSAFLWRGQRCLIESYGRRWVDDTGGRHVLVMSQAHGTFELYHDPRQDKWYLLRAWTIPTVA
jgi:nicotinamide-nucleotide amidase